MILKKEMIHIKSNSEVIRSICIEFNHFTIDQMDIFKTVVSDYLGCDTGIFTKGQFCIVTNGPNFIEEHLLKKGIKIYDELVPLLTIELHFYGKPTKQCIINVKVPLHIPEISPKHIKQCVIKITRRIGQEIYSKLSQIESAETRTNYFIKDIAIWDGDFNGKYDFGEMKIDFGLPNPNRSQYKIARCFIKYTLYKVNIENSIIFSFIEREEKIFLALLQCFLRFPIYEMDTNDGFLPSSYSGKYVHIIRKDIYNDYIIDWINNDKIPDDIPRLFSLFQKLTDELKNIFLNSVYCYCEGLKNVAAKSIAYYTISLETLASYEARKNNWNISNKTNMIYDFLGKIIPNCRIEHQVIEKIYSIRSAHVHNGVANNDLLDELFFKSNIITQNYKVIERITNYSLILWLIKQ